MKRNKNNRNHEIIGGLIGFILGTPIYIKLLSFGVIDRLFKPCSENSLFYKQQLLSKFFECPIVESLVLNKSHPSSTAELSLLGILIFLIITTLLGVFIARKIGERG